MTTIDAQTNETVIPPRGFAHATNDVVFVTRCGVATAALSMAEQHRGKQVLEQESVARRGSRRLKAALDGEIDVWTNGELDAMKRGVLKLTARRERERRLAREVEELLNTLLRA